MTIIETITRIMQRLDADPEAFGTLSTGEACAAALLLGDVSKLPRGYSHPLDALDRLGDDWREAVMAIHKAGWK